MAREMLEKIIEAEKQAEEKINLAKVEAEQIISDASLEAEKLTKSVLEEAQRLYDNTVNQAQISGDKLTEDKVTKAKNDCLSFSVSLEEKKKECFEAVLEKIVR